MNSRLLVILIFMLVIACHSTFARASVMLYVIHMANSPELDYQGGQGDIVHLEADLRKSVHWAEQNGRRWAFTLSNAGSYYFEDRCDMNQLNEVDWHAVAARQWSHCKENKQAEFLLEQTFPWNLVGRIGVASRSVLLKVKAELVSAKHQPNVQLMPDWYY